MGSGGSRTLWSPSYEAGAKAEVLETVHLGNGIWRHLAEIQPHRQSRTVDDGEILKRE